MKTLISSAILLAAISCSVDYDPGKTLIVEEDRLVVNSILNPLHPIRICFHATCKTGAGYTFKPVEGVAVLLKENGEVLYEGICRDTALHLDRHPQTGAFYYMEASLPGYEKVSAGTGVPDSITCTARIDFSNVYWSNLNVVSLSDFQLPQGEICLWVITYAGYKDGQVLQYDELFANHLLADRINRQEGSMVVNETVGSGYHDAFLRFRHKSLPYLDSLQYTPLIAYSEADYPSWQLHVTDIVKIITAGKEYDQYNRSLYQQKAMTVYDDDISAILYQPIQVYSNIRNGLGIFAGMSEANYYFAVPEMEDPYPWPNP